MVSADYAAVFMDRAPRSETSRHLSDSLVLSRVKVKDKVQ